MSGIGRRPEPAPWTVLASETLVDSPWLRVHRQRVRTATGHEIAEYFLVDGQDFVVVLALTVDRRAILVHQYRHGVRRAILELPAGIVDPDDASPAASAERELLEETGYRAGHLEPLGSIHPGASRQPTRAHCFLALDCRWETEPHGDPAECIELELVDLAALKAAARRGELPGAPSLACLWLGLERLRELGRLAD